uniref:MbeD/MobD family mobilization/exclusion protein n=1 Tax=Klebsiella pneumoniae TaxID=573 RepID=UPI002485A1D5|nr:MbeD/MobD family mobilization/exclusion protein [Klebsiella pneumoniae]WGU82669.1 MbeD/MobD family mobilization/exclusion protein [Klebsiella pneumoniae]
MPTALEQLHQDYSQRLDEWETPSRNGRRCLVLCNGERGAERARHALESAGGELEQAVTAFEPVVQRHEMAVAAERAYEQRQHEKELAEACSLSAELYNGPTLG